MFVQFIKAVFLGILQGVTEFLPVSSTGHLIISEHVLGISQEKFGLTFDAALHLGTAGAVFLFFWPQWVRILSSFWKDVGKLLNNIKRHSGESRTRWCGTTPESRFWTSQNDGLKGQSHNVNSIYRFLIKSGMTERNLWFYLFIGTLPAAIIGFFLEETIENAFRQPVLVAFALLFGSLIIFLSEKLGKKEKNLGKIDFFSSLIIGFSQSLALIPGISRSGVTISSGMFLGFKRRVAGEFAFLLSGPIVLGAGGKKLLDVISSFVDGGLALSELSFFVIGIITAALAGFFTIKFLLKYLTYHSMNIFVIYRILLATLVLIFLC